MKIKRRIRAGSLLLAMVLSVSTLQPAYAAVTYMPDVTAEMSDASFWAEYHDGYSDVILTQEEIKAFNEDTYIASGTMVMDLRTIQPTFDGKARNESIRKSATADAEYYFGWTYGSNGKAAPWSYYEKMIRNCIDPKAKSTMPLRYAVAVERTTLRVFPSNEPIWATIASAFVTLR